MHWEPAAEYGYRDRPITSNAPLRGGKATIYEGGTRAPMVIVYPPVIAPASESAQLIGSLDVFPTVIGLAVLEADVAFDGHDLGPVLRGGDVVEPLADRSIFVHFPHGWGQRSGYQPSSSLRVGDHKIIRFYADLPDGGDRYELYDLVEDIGETNDLSKNQPALLTLCGRVTRKHLRGKLQGGRLMLECVGPDPYLVATDVPAVVGPHVVETRLKASAGGVGDVYLATTNRPNFNRDARIGFVYDVDQRIRVSIDPKTPLTGLRIDPINATGDVEIDYVRLLDPDGVLVKAWEFGE